MGGAKREPHGCADVGLEDAVVPLAPLASRTNCHGSLTSHKLSHVRACSQFKCFLSRVMDTRA